jgi:hypothetical protein
METTVTTYCQPCPPLGQLRCFHAGDAVRVTAPDAGFEHGRIFPILGYSRTPEGYNIIIEGTMSPKVREFCLQPESTREVLFKKFPNTGIAEIPVMVGEDYLEYVPAGEQLPIMTVYRNPNFQYQKEAA